MLVCEQAPETMRITCEPGGPSEPREETPTTEGGALRDDRLTSTLLALASGVRAGRDR